ncbi:transposase [Nitrosomonas sp. GH22]|nr:transposase [Nitrosomonas sp. GH22]
MENPPADEFYMKKQRRQFDTSFKLEIVRMIKEQGLSIAHISEA